MAWTNYQQRTEQLQQLIAAKAALADPAKQPESFYDEQELGLMADAALEEWLSTAGPGNSGDADVAPAPSYNESDSYQIRTLRWLMNNAETASDKQLARDRYIDTLFGLWRKHVSLTGETYYKGLREEIWERYQSVQHELS